MLIAVVEALTLQIPVCPVRRGHVVRDSRSNGNFDAFQRSHGQLAKRTVELVKRINLVQAGPVFKAAAFRSHVLEWAHIGDQAEITRDFQQAEGAIAVPNLEPILDQPVKLLLGSKCRLVETHQPPLAHAAGRDFPQAIKNPLDLSVGTEVLRGLAGLLALIIRQDLVLCKVGWGG